MGDTNPSKWYRVYKETHKPSFRNYLDFNVSCEIKIKLKPGEIKGIYIHSTLPGDQAIVYDNHYGTLRKSDTLEDPIIKIHPALAHVCEIPFGTIPPWGWGNAWRKNRKFVGRISYGIVYKLWHPQYFSTYGTKFQRLVHLLLCCQRRKESPISLLPDDCIFYILHLCKWDWVDDNYNTMEYSFLNRYMLEQQNHQQKKKPKESNYSSITNTQSNHDNNVDNTDNIVGDDEGVEDNLSSNGNNHSNDDNNLNQTEENNDEDDDEEGDDERIFDEDFTVLFERSTIDNEQKNKYYSIQRSKIIPRTNSNTNNNGQNSTEFKNLRSRIRRISVGFVILISLQISFEYIYATYIVNTNMHRSSAVNSELKNILRLCSTISLMKIMLRLPTFDDSYIDLLSCMLSIASLFTVALSLFSKDKNLILFCSYLAFLAKLIKLLK